MIRFDACFLQMGASSTKIRYRINVFFGPRKGKKSPSSWAFWPPRTMQDSTDEATITVSSGDAVPWPGKASCDSA